MKKIKKKEFEYQKEVVSFCRKLKIPIWGSASGIWIPGLTINIINFFKSIGIINEKGEPDFFIPLVKKKDNVIISGGLFLEMKTESGKPSKEQLEKINYYNNNGYTARIVYSSEEAINTILAYKQD